MLPIKQFRLVFCLFRFNQNIETLCFGIEAKQPKQTFCFGQCRNQFRFQFRLFRIETSFEGHPILNEWVANVKAVNGQLNRCPGRSFPVLLSYTTSSNVKELLVVQTPALPEGGGLSLRGNSMFKTQWKSSED